MTDAASNAIQVAAICGAIAVVVYSVSSCMQAPMGGYQAQIECIKQHGDWRNEWSGSRCVFPSVTSNK